MQLIKYTNDSMYAFYATLVSGLGLEYLGTTQTRKITNKYITVDWSKQLKSNCTHFLYCPVRLDWLDCTALFRPLRAVCL